MCPLILGHMLPPRTVAGSHLRYLEGRLGKCQRVVHPPVGPHPKLNIKGTSCLSPYLGHMLPPRVVGWKGNGVGGGRGPSSLQAPGSTPE